MISSDTEPKMANIGVCEPPPTPKPTVAAIGQHDRGADRASQCVTFWIALADPIDRPAPHASRGQHAPDVRPTGATECLGQPVQSLSARAEPTRVQRVEQLARRSTRGRRRRVAAARPARSRPEDRAPTTRTPAPGARCGGSRTPTRRGSRSADGRPRPGRRATSASIALQTRIARLGAVRQGQALLDRACRCGGGDPVRPDAASRSR